MNNAASIQLQQTHDKVVHALIWDYMIPCMLAGIALIILGGAFAILRASIRKRFGAQGGRRRR